MKVIIINGRGGAGKDAFIDMCGKHAKVASYSSVELIKEAAAVLGWNGKKDLVDRKFLSDLKDLSSKYNDGPMTYLRKCYHGTPSCTDILFMHVREPEDIKKCVKEFNASTLIVRRPGDSTYGNHADDNVENFVYDYSIENNGTLKDLDKKAMVFCNALKL